MNGEAAVAIVLHNSLTNHFSDALFVSDNGDCTGQLSSYKNSKLRPFIMQKSPSLLRMT